MSLVTESEVRGELSVFTGISNDPCYADFVAVSVFLADRLSVVAALGTLEAAIRRKAEVAWQGSEDYRSRRTFYLANNIDLHLLDTLMEARLVSHLTGGGKSAYFKHLVSGCLTDLEIASSFSVSGNLWSSKAQYYLGPLEADAFREQISAGRPPGKDPYVDPGHGEYTHRIQWYAVMAAGFRLRLAHPVVTVYKAVGGHAAPEGAYAGFRWGLWDAVCDRDNGTAEVVPFKAVGSTDFRCPNCLNTFLREHGMDHGLPILSAFARGRYAKRAAKDAVDPMDYIARKVYKKKDAKSLTKTEHETIERLVLKEMRAVYDPNLGWRY